MCRAPLTLDAGAASCRSAHRFDVARQGYLNLLASPQPANADTADMVEARTRVLGSGAFDVIDEALARRLQGARVVLDAGGGTGHHLARLLDAVPQARGVTIDVSVAAARRAARAHERAASVVADVWETLPLLSGRFDTVMCLFAPRNMREFARVLADGGLLAVVTPEQAHLAAVRDAYGLLDVEPGKDDRLLRSASGLFQPIARTVVRAGLDASAALVRDLVAMGPNAFHGLPEAVEAMPTEVAVSLWLFRKASPGAA